MLGACRRLCSPSLEDAAWLEDAQLIFLIFDNLSVKFGWVDGCLDSVHGRKIADKCVENWRNG